MSLPIAVITGASSGIGAASALHFSKNGYEVYLTARNLDRLGHVAEKLEGPSKIFTCDVADKDSIAKLITDISASTSQIDCLVNNAGIVHWNSIEDSTDLEWEEQFNINLMGPVRLSKGLLPLLKAGSGSVINIASSVALRHLANTAAYSASKAALVMLTKNMAGEWAPYNVRVNSVCPAVVNTPIQAFHGKVNEDVKSLMKDIHPLGRMGEPEEIADSILFLAKHTWMTGSNLVVDGGASL